MCGIVGLYTKSPDLEQNLGSMLSDMLIQMTDRGPDSAGFALYHDPVSEGGAKITLQADDGVDWQVIQDAVKRDLSSDAVLKPIANHGVLTLDMDGEQAAQWIEGNLANVNITSVGSSIEIFKEKGLPDQVINKFDLASMSGTHALGHTRMATESAVTTEHSHPFSTGRDLCLVHNGSLSNHNQLREKLRWEGIRFQTDNDSEVAAGYLTWRLGQGANLNEALEAALVDLDGFYTFAIGTKDGFAVLRDPIACKPAILAETDEWVAMASEYRAIAQLPNSENARIWEPEPARIYSWERS
ncbi:MAG: amidophosphoribosyltransferase [Gammaproteobacteria bacterium]|nr:amidophosphoribosyltransferase [Gammaproteobacteria bacterium]